MCTEENCRRRLFRKYTPTKDTKLQSRQSGKISNGWQRWGLSALSGLPLICAADLQIKFTVHSSGRGMGRFLFPVPVVVHSSLLPESFCRRKHKKSTARASRSWKNLSSTWWQVYGRVKQEWKKLSVLKAKQIQIQEDGNKLTFPGNYYFFLPVTCRFLRNNIFRTETPARGVHDRAPV